MWSRKTHNSISSNRDFLSFCEDLHSLPVLSPRHYSQQGNPRL
ncbi:hypothetical protein FOXYSP1_04850 [Fusarium oxysporum f. sp. phaseoli]